MPPRRYNEFLQRTRGTKTETPTRTRRTVAPRTSTPQDMEMSARAERVGRGRQTAPAAGRQGLGGSAMYSIQDMLNHPAVEWSRNMARGPAQGKVDSITNDVMAKLSEQGLNRGPDGTWGIDFAKNTAYRNGRNGSSENPVYTAATPTIPSSGTSGGFPGPAKPPAPTGGTLPRQTAGGLPPGTLPRQPTTGGLPPGTLPRQGPVYEPGKPPAPPVGKMPADMAPVPSPGLGGGFPSTVTPVIGQRGTTQPVGKPPQPQGTSQPAPVVGGWSSQNPSPTQARSAQVSGYRGADPNMPMQNINGQNMQSVTVTHPPGQQGLPPGTLPRQGQPQQPVIPTGMPRGVQMPQGKPPQGFPQPQQTQMPQRPQGMPTGFGQSQPMDLSNLGGQIRQQVQSMVGGMQQNMARQQGGQLPGLAGLGERIRADVQGGLSGMRNQMRPAGNPTGGQLPGMAGLGERIRGQVQGGLGGMQRPGMPQVPTGGPISPTNPGGQGGIPPGPNGLPPQGGPAPGNPSPAPPTGPGTGSLGSYGNASIDQWDAAFQSAGQQYGVDPRILKAMAEIESGGNGNIPLDQCRDDGYGDGGSCGLMQVKPNIWGSVGSTEEQIAQAAKILADYKAANPGATDKDALFAVYFTGDDPNGTTQGSYGARVDELVNQMGNYVQPASDPAVQQLPNTGTGGTLPTQPGGQNVPSQPPPGPPQQLTLPANIGQIPDLGLGQDGQTIVDIANLYVGVVPYESLDVWNGNPGQGVDPRDPSQNGWDCSGMVYWLDQNYGKGQIPQGSNEQAAWFAQNDPNFTSRNAAVQAGDYSSLRVGDIVYLDTSSQGGTCRQGNCAGHVVVYAGNGTFVNSANPSEGTTIWQGLNGYPVVGVATYW